MKYVVAGTGYTGRRVLEALPSGSVMGISRSPLSSAGPPVRILDLDLDPAGTLALDTMAPFTLLYTIPPRSDGDGDPRLAAFLGQLNLAPARVVYLSTSGVYGDRDSRLTDESVAPQPRTDRARRRVAAETLLRLWCDDHDADWTILRVPGIYGPGRLGLERLAHGGTILRDEDAGPGNRIHVEDLVRCCIAAMQPSTPAGIYNLGDGDPRSSGRFTTAVARLSGLPVPEEISLDEARRTWSAARMSFLEESRLLDVSRMRDELGVTPLYADPEDGIRASLRLEGASGVA